MLDSQKGSVLVIVIAGITIIAAIGAGVASLITSSARMGVNHSQSVQALYAAESGLEWAGKELREAFKDEADWKTTCGGWSDEGPFTIGQASFTITGKENFSPDGCEVTVVGWIGSYENPLVKRQIIGNIPKSFIEDPGGSGEDGIPDDAIIIGGEGEDLPELNVGTHETVYVKEGTTINGDIDISNHSDVYFYNDVTVTGGVTLAPQGFVYFGDNFHIEGNIIISGEACFGDNVRINGDLTLSTADAIVCIKDNFEITGKITLANNSQLCVGLNSNIHCNDIDKENNSQICTKDLPCDYKCSAGYSSVCTDECGVLCETPPALTGEGGSQNPIGTEDGSWSEG